MAVIELISFFFIINFSFVFLIYPLIIKDKMVANKRILNVKIKISKFRYFSSCFNCGCMICILLYEYYQSIRYPFGRDNNFLLAGMIVWAIVIVVNLYRIIFIYPKRYLVFINNKMYYHNGFKEICIDNISNTMLVRIGWKISYWYLLLKTDTNKRLWIDVLLLDKPEYVHATIESMAG